MLSLSDFLHTNPYGGKSILAQLFFFFNFISIIVGKYDTMLKTPKNLEMAVYDTKIVFPV